MLPLNANTTRCSRTEQVKSGQKMSNSYSFKVCFYILFLKNTLPIYCILGLREYWESPWATFSRGRSRWRNQFLVDYLQKSGIERSRKQVASHIQVLRNMWKGSAEFHLVAGGEELFSENGLLAHTSPATRQSSIPVSNRSSSRDSHRGRASPTSSDSSFESETSPMAGVMQLQVNTDVRTSPSNFGFFLNYSHTNSYFSFIYQPNTRTTHLFTKSSSRRSSNPDQR